jgi:hypothetical protein
MLLVQVLGLGVGLLSVSGAHASGRAATSARHDMCAGVSGVHATAEWRLEVEADCTVTTRAHDGSTLGRLDKGALAPHRGALPRLSATDEWLVVLPGNGAEVETYRLPTLTRVPVRGTLEVREPGDLVLRVDGQGALTGYVIDNAPESERYGGAERAAIGSRVVRFRLTAHASDRRDLMILRVDGHLGTHFVRHTEWRTLLGLELDGPEVRVVVDEDGRLFQETYTLDGVPIERIPLGGRAPSALDEGRIGSRGPGAGAAAPSSGGCRTAESSTAVTAGTTCSDWHSILPISSMR